LAKGQENADKYTRLGFEVEDLQKTIKKLKEANFDVSQPQQTEFGIIAIAIDPDGRKVEIY
jgi:lactoylglutathione lyase